MPPRPLRRPAPRNVRRAAGAGAPRRAALAVESLEGRFQPSATAVLPTLVSPDLFVAPGPAAFVSPAAPEPAAPAGRRELVLVDFDVPERDALVSDLLAAPDGTSVEVVRLHGGGWTRRPRC